MKNYYYLFFIAIVLFVAGYATGKFEPINVDASENSNIIGKWYIVDVNPSNIVFARRKENNPYIVFFEDGYFGEFGLGMAGSGLKAHSLDPTYTIMENMLRIGSIVYEFEINGDKLALHDGVDHYYNLSRTK